jgi:hypothetical protein
MRYLSLSGCFLKLPAPAEKAKPPLRIVKCIVARPCLIATISFVLPVILSVIGWQIVVSSSGPDGPFLQLNYPVADPIAKQSNAFILAQEEADTVRVRNLGETRRRLSVADGASAIRRTSTATDTFNTVMRQAQLLTAELAAVTTSSQEAPSLRQLSGRALQTTSQLRQTEEMASALFAFRAYEEDGDSFSQAGLAELCGLHTALVSADGYSDYCKREKIILLNGTQAAGDCQPPVTPLVFFYGPASYDPSSVDLAVFDMPDFETIAAASNEQLSASSQPCEAECVSAIQDSVMAETNCTAEEFTRVFSFGTTLAFEFLPHWLSSNFDCSTAQLKDIDQVRGSKAGPCLGCRARHTLLYLLHAQQSDHLPFPHGSGQGSCRAHPCISCAHQLRQLHERLLRQELQPAVPKVALHPRLLFLRGATSRLRHVRHCL